MISLETNVGPERTSGTLGSPPDRRGLPRSEFIPTARNDAALRSATFLRRCTDWRLFWAYETGNITPGAVRGSPASTRVVKHAPATGATPNSLAIRIWM